MRLAGLSTAALLVAAILHLSVPGPANALRLPSAFIREQSAEELEDTCQCDCCYTVGLAGRTECVPPTDTTFDTPRCSDCDVESCAKAFPVACGQQSSVVSTDCIQRKGWMLQLVPVFFIIASLSLLLYGLFFKTYDGYHDDNRPAPTVTEVLPQGKIPSFGTFPSSYGSGRDSDRQNLIARAASKLPPISEHAEVAAEEEIIPEVEQPLIPDVEIGASAAGVDSVPVQHVRETVVEEANE